MRRNQVDDLIKQLEEKTGLDVDKIKSVVEGVMDFLGDKLPAPIADHVKKLLGGDDDGTKDDGGEGGDDLLGQAKDLLGGLLD
jgi:hypothetical protein